MVAGTLRLMAHPDDVVYAPADRPVCEVRPDPDTDTWYPGEVRALFRREDGWHINANWTVDHVSTYSRTLPAVQVRHPGRDDRDWANGPR